MHCFKSVRAGGTLLAAGVLAAGAIQAGDIKGQVTAQGLKSPENIAVYVDAIAGKDFPAPTAHAVVDQRRMTFIPHVLVVLKGTAVDFLNSDAVGHNVYWPSITGNKKLAHNLGTWPQNVKKSFTFTDLGAAPLLCNVHAEMSGYVVVVPTPYFATTAKDGSFEIKDVPPGSYTLKTWSEEGKPATAAVTVAAGTATANLTVRR
jgi:plastocyanin